MKTLRSKIILSTFLITSVTSLIFMFFVYQSQKELYKTEIDSKLQLAAQAGALYLGNELVDQFNQASPMDPKSHLNLVKTLSEYAQKNGLEYIYLMVKEGDKIYTVISSATPEELAQNEYDPFYTEYEASEMIQNGFHKNNRFYEDTIDKYGHFRSYIQINESKNGKLYMIGADISVTDIEKDLQTLLLKTLGILVLAILFSFIVSMWIASKITQRLTNLTLKVETLSSTLNLNESFSESGDDEIGRLNDALGCFVKTIDTVILNATEVAQENVSIAQSTVKEAKNVSEKISDTRSLIHNNLIEIEKITQKIDEMNQYTMDVVESLNTAEGELETTKQSIHNVASSARHSAQEGQKVADRLHQLEHDAEHIRSFLTIINDIAYQTNLLALNAAIEAARAGEHGRGFAIVADEVRKLAERTQEGLSEVASTTEHIIQSIEEIANETIGSSQTIVNLSKVSEVSEELIQNATVAMLSAVKVMHNTRDHYLILKEHGKSVSENMSRIDHHSVDNISIMTEMDQSIHHVSDLSSQLGEKLDLFKR